MRARSRNSKLGPRNKPTFIDLFCGIGGFHYAFEAAGASCVWAADWDEKARNTYAANHGMTPYGDITKANYIDLKHPPALLDHDDDPFASRAFLGTAEKVGAGGTAMGWQAQHLALHENGQLLGLLPLYLRSHSFGDFSRDWNWASAWQRAGLAYYSLSRINASFGPGTWRMLAGVNPANVDKTVKLMMREAERMTSTLVTVEELAENQSQIIGMLPLRLESNEGVAGALASMELFGLGLDYLQRVPGIIAALTRAELRAAARRYLQPQRHVLAVAGPE